jgi:sulfoxide reductase catalytic subunit YedY
MSEKFKADLPSLRPTPPEVFFRRREFLSLAGLGVLAAPLDLCASPKSLPREELLKVPIKTPALFPAERNSKYALPEGLARKSLTPREVAASHNNFYEFLPGRGGPVWEHAGAFEPEPWKVEVEGECAKPRTFDLDDLFKFEHEERLYHFRCVERWAMNVPWTGFPLRKLLEKVEPTANARFVRFVTAKRPEQMPGLAGSPWYPWPYHEGLRMDEAMHELTLVATGVYGAPLLKQHGAPVRIVAPWKYGYKNPKSIVKIELVRKQPKTFWQIQPHEYGFLSNVNPNIPHPRWSQAKSHWLDTREAFPTAIFNGYEKYVAGLYPDEPRTPQQPLGEGQTAR